MKEIEAWRVELASPDVRLRAAAAEGLCHAAEDAAPAAVELVQACGDEDESVQTWAAAALEDLGVPPVATIDRLTRLFASPQPLVAYWAISLVGRLGPNAACSETALAIALTEATDLAVREQAAWALGKLKVTSDASVTALEQAQQSGSPRLSRLAQEALSTLQR